MILPGLSAVDSLPRGWPSGVMATRAVAFLWEMLKFRLLNTGTAYPETYITDHNSLFNLEITR